MYWLNGTGWELCWGRLTINFFFFFFFCRAIKIPFLLWKVLTPSLPQGVFLRVFMGGCFNRWLPGELWEGSGEMHVVFVPGFLPGPRSR